MTNNDIFSSTETIPNVSAEGQKSANVPNLRLAGFNDSWFPTTLSTISSYRKIHRTSTKKNYVSTENILQNYQGIERFTSDESVSGDGFDRDDILMGNIRPYLKKVCLADFDGVCNADVLVFKSESVNPHFLHCILANDSFINYAMSSVKGSKMPRGDKGHIMQYPLSIPSTEEQVKIADFISLLNERIYTQNKIIEKYQSQMNSIIDGIVDYSAPQIKFEELYVTAGEGGTPSTNIKEYYENGNIPFVKIDDLTEKYLFQHKETITELGLKNSSAWLVPSNSVIFSNGATVGRISINTYPITTKQGILGIVPKEQVLTEYLYYFMRSKYFRRQVCRITVRGTMECAYLKDLNTITCFIPSIDKQEKTLKLLHSLDSRLDIEQHILQKLKEQKKFLLSQMFI